MKQQDLMHSMNQDLAKKSASEKLNEEIEAWLAKGNKIDVKPAGYSGFSIKKKQSKNGINQHSNNESRKNLELSCSSHCLRSGKRNMESNVGLN